MEEVKTVKPLEHLLLMMKVNVRILKQSLILESLNNFGRTWFGRSFGCLHPGIFQKFSEYLRPGIKQPFLAYYSSNLPKVNKCSEVPTVFFLCLDPGSKLNTKTWHVKKLFTPQIRLVFVQFSSKNFSFFVIF